MNELQRAEMAFEKANAEVQEIRAIIGNEMADRAVRAHLRQIAALESLSLAQQKHARDELQKRLTP